MYRDTVTLFCRVPSGGSLFWVPYILKNVDFNADKARILSVYGESSQDRAILHLALNKGKCNGLKYVYPKEYMGDATTFTLKSGKDFDFFVLGAYEFGTVNDDDYKEGFFNYINKTLDNVFMITSAAEYSIIPHIEVTGR